MDDKSFLEKWYDICLEFYLNENDSDQNHSFLLYFDKLAPTSSETDSNRVQGENRLDDNRNSLHEQRLVGLSTQEEQSSSSALHRPIREDSPTDMTYDDKRVFSDYLGVNIEDLVRNDTELWFHMNEKRNQARQQSHQYHMRKRRETMIQSLEQSHEIITRDILTNALYDAILLQMSLFIKLAQSDSSLLPTLLGGLYTWIKMQTRENNKCLSWNVDIDIIFERDKITQKTVINAACSLGTYQYDNESGILSWTMRSQVSNSFLQRLMRIIKRAFYIHHFNIEKYETNLAKNVTTNQQTNRDNVDGSNDGSIVNFMNIILPCQIL